jgi:hypothetical protein
MINSSIRRMSCAVLVVVGACSSDSTVPDAELVKTYAEVVVARQTTSDSTQLRRTLDSILVAHELDSASFDEALREMSRSPEMFKGFFDSVTKQIDRLRDTTGQ